MHKNWTTTMPEAYHDANGTTQVEAMPEERGPGHPAKLPQPTESIGIRASAEVIEYLKSQDDSPGVFIDELIRRTAGFKAWKGKKR